MKNIFKGWSVLELILLTVAPICILTVGIIFKSDVLTIIASIIGVFCALFLAKGLVAGQFIGIVLVVFYSIVSFNNGFYGEMIIYIALMLPMYIWSIVEWAKHKNQNTQSVEINHIKPKEWLVVAIVAVAVFIGLYFLLKLLNTNELFVSTLSVVDNIFAIYLLARRSKYGFLSYIVNDIILIVLWGLPVINGNLLLLPMLLNPIINLVNDSYGIINWTKLQKMQSMNKIKEKQN